MAAPEDPLAGRRAVPTPDPVDALADLESRAAAWGREERAAEVEDRAVEAYRAVTLAARLVASLGQEIGVDLGAAGALRGSLVDAGDGWLVVDGSPPVLVLTDAAVALSGVAEGAASAAAWPLGSRRTLAAVLHRQVQGRRTLLVTTRDGSRHRGTGSRVGADFVELRGEGRDGGEGGDGGHSGAADGRRALLVPLSAIATVRRA